MYFTNTYMNELTTSLKDKCLEMYNAESLYILYLGPCYINERCYKGTLLQRNYRKMTIYGYFPIIPL